MQIHEWRYSFGVRLRVLRFWWRLQVALKGTSMYLTSISGKQHVVQHTDPISTCTRLAMCVDATGRGSATPRRYGPEYITYDPHFLDSRLLHLIFLPLLLKVCEAVSM